MGWFWNKPRIIHRPVLGILDLLETGRNSDAEYDRQKLESFFASIRESRNIPPRCDVLFVYADLEADGRVRNIELSLREIVRDSGATIVVFASANTPESYLGASGQARFGKANLVMTLDRRGQVFSSFLRRLFEKMAQGVSMPVAWNELAPQVPGQNQADCPATIFACERGQVAFA